jgi:carboxyl-terminal processing protease
MTNMRRLFPAVILAIVACTSGASDSTAPSAPTTATTGLVATTTTETPLPVEIDDCSAPQVTFSPLCETYELIQKWHVDRPVDPAILAEAALSGLQNWSTDQVADPPRTLICAIPDASFTEVCNDLAERVEERSVPIGLAVEAAVLAMADLGLDPFSYYLPPDQVGAFRSNGIVEGVGVLLDATDAAGSRCVRITSICELRVVYVLDDNPGAAAGLAAGDVIVAVDGLSVEGLGFVDTATRIAGDHGGTVSLDIDRDGEVLDFEIERAELVIPTVKVDIPLPGVGYIRIPDFEDDIPGLVDDGLESLLVNPIDTIVIDLRDNGGGLIDVAIDVISEFVTEGTILRTVGPDEDLQYPATPGGLATTQDLVVLVNEGTASAAEIMAGALRDLRGASVVGSATFGKDAVQIAFELRNGGEFHVAVARWLSPRDVSVANGGLVPDRDVDLSPELPTSAVVELALEGTR